MAIGILATKAVVLVPKVSLVAYILGGIYLREMGSKTVSEVTGFGGFSLCVPGCGICIGISLLRSCSASVPSHQPHHQTHLEMLITPPMQKKNPKTKTRDRYHFTHTSYRIYRIGKGFRH